jgi:hypothetical protein
MELEDLDADDDGDGFGQAGTKVWVLYLKFLPN